MVTLKFYLSLDLAEPAPGCIDQKLSTFGMSEDGLLKHEELPIPMKTDAPYALEILLDKFREQYMNMLEMYKDPQYKFTIRKEIDEERVSVKFVIYNISCFDNVIFT